MQDQPIDQPVSIEAPALAVLIAASERFQKFGQKLHDAGNQEVSQDDLAVLKAAIQQARQALSKTEPDDAG